MSPEGLGRLLSQALRRQRLLCSVQAHLQTGQNAFGQLPNTSVQSSLAPIDCLCHNLLHIVRVGRTTIGKNIWDHICLGSDLNGLIVAIEYQTDQRVKASHIPDLRKKLKETLPQVAQKMGVPLRTDGPVSDAFLETILDKFFLGNALRFLKTYYTRPAPASPLA